MRRTIRSVVALSMILALLGWLPPAGGTVEQPVDTAQVWLVNGTEQSIDVYVNYDVQPAITDVKAMSIGPEYQVKGKDDTPFGTYTFSARAKAAPGGPVLAAASVRLQAGESYSAVLHQTGSGDYRMSIYRNDFAPTGDTRMTVRNTSSSEEVTWRLDPTSSGTAPHDERGGTLTNGRWQAALDVAENDYRLQVFANDTLVALHPDLELEHEKNIVVYVVGDPQPSSDPVQLRAHVLEQELQVPAGPPEPDTVTEPADPWSSVDQNAPIEWDCPALDVWQTNVGTVGVSAVDPDGVVTWLSIRKVLPASGGITMPDDLVTPASTFGGNASAAVRVDRDVPAGQYVVTVEANRGSRGQHASCDLQVTVQPVTIQRLHGLVSSYDAEGEVQAWLAANLHERLDGAGDHLAAGRVGDACEDLKQFLAQIGAEKDKAITVAAHDRLARETTALRADLGCG